MTITDGCEVLRLGRRRFYRWLEDKPAVVRCAWNRITAKEEEEIVTAGRDEKLTDLRAAGLMVYGHETGKFYCSISTIQRVLIRNRLQAEYTVPTRKRPEKPYIRQLMTEPKRVFSYDATDFYLTNRLRVVVIPILDLGSRKFIHYGIRVTSFRQQDVMDIWDEALCKEGIDASLITALSDRGGQMKGGLTKAHLSGKWDIRLKFARPYTPDDNAWIEAFIKYMKYHPDCPEEFEMVQDIADWIATFQKLYNDHPHSSLGYRTPAELRPYRRRGETGSWMRTSAWNAITCGRGRPVSSRAESLGSDAWNDDGLSLKAARRIVTSSAVNASKAAIFHRLPARFRRGLRPRSCSDPEYARGEAIGGNVAGMANGSAGFHMRSLSP